MMSWTYTSYLRDALLTHNKQRSELVQGQIWGLNSEVYGQDSLVKLQQFF